MSDTSAPPTSTRRRRTLLAATGVVALVAASVGMSEVSDARPLELEVVVSATATPSEVLVDETVTVAGEVADGPYEVGSVGDPQVAGCSAGDIVQAASLCVPPPSGDVDIVIDDVVVDSVALDGSASFSWSTNELLVGTHEIVVSYPGDDYRLAGESDPMLVEVGEPLPAPTGTYRDGGASSTTTPGGRIVVTGGGWLASSEVTATLRSDPFVLGTSVAGADGTVSQEYVVPASTPLGAHTITLDGTGADGSPAAVVLDLQVVAAAEAAPAPAATPSSLSFTG
jgi:hypothetical protein